MNSSMQFRTAQLTLCILFAMTGGKAIAGITGCNGSDTTATGTNGSRLRLQRQRQRSKQ